VGRLGWTAAARRSAAAAAAASSVRGSSGILPYNMCADILKRGKVLQDEAAAIAVVLDQFLPVD